MVESSVCMNIASIAEAVSRPRYGTRVVSDIFPGRQRAGGLCTRIGDNATGGPARPCRHRGHPRSSHAPICGKRLCGRRDHRQGSSFRALAVRAPDIHARTPVPKSAPADGHTYPSVVSPTVRVLIQSWPHPPIMRRRRPRIHRLLGRHNWLCDPASVAGCFRAAVNTWASETMARTLTAGSETHGKAAFFGSDLDPDQCRSLDYLVNFRYLTAPTHSPQNVARPRCHELHCAIRDRKESF